MHQGDWSRAVALFVGEATCDSKKGGEVKLSTTIVNATVNSCLLPMGSWIGMKQAHEA